MENAAWGGHTDDCIVTSPRLSIVTVVRNSLPLLKSTVNSLLEQTDQSFEYVIIDGASTDNTLDFVLGKPAPARVIVSEPDDGIYAAMNKAPLHCSGDYIQFLNAGDHLCDAQSIAAVMPFLDGRHDVVIFHYRIHGQQYRPELSFRRLLGGTPCHQAIFYKRNYLQACPFDTRLKYCADYHHLLNALAKGSIRIAEPAIIDYDTTGVSSRKEARRRIRLERAWSGWHSQLGFFWRLAIASYNLFRALR